jgi:cyclic pyranopterin monophosphate synthase
MTKMVDVSGKLTQKRRAIAEGRLKLKASTVKAIRARSVKKGDVLTVSQIAGIQAAKGTSDIIPLCHQIPLSSVEVQFKLVRDTVVARTTVITTNVTGVEMEALVGTTVALLSVWDMVKYLEKDEKGQYPVTTLFDVKVVEKSKEDI